MYINEYDTFVSIFLFLDPLKYFAVNIFVNRDDGGKKSEGRLICIFPGKEGGKWLFFSSI